MMNIYRYRIYYEWRGPSASDIFAEEKSATDLEWAFERLPNELEMRLADPDPDAVARTHSVHGTPNEVILTVSTASTTDQFTNALVATLKDWGLFGMKVK